MLRIVISLCLVFVPVCSAAGKTVVIYHTADIHSWYFPRNPDWDDSGRRAGGGAALAAVLKKEPGALLLDSGDWFSGTPEGADSRGMASIELLNALGCKASVIGNHEYDYGEKRLKMLVAAADFPVLGANIYSSKTGRRVDYAKPYAILEYGGVRLGVIGLIRENALAKRPPRFRANLEFRNPEKELAPLLAGIEKQGVDAVIVLAHEGISPAVSRRRVDGASLSPSADGTLSLARAFKGRIALILGGHEHAALDGGYHDPESGTFFAESGGDLLYTSRIELEFDDASGKFTGARIKLIELDTAETGEDKAIADMLEPLREKTDARLSKTVGRAAEPLARYDIERDSSLCRFVSDAMRRAAGADIAFQNLSGLRADVHAGPVKAKDLYLAMPYDYTLVSMELSGAQVERILRESLENRSAELCISGLHARYSLAPDGRIAELSVSVGGRPLDAGALYKVATNNSIAEGGLPSSVFLEGGNTEDTGKNLLDVITSEFSRQSPVSPPKDARIVRTP